MDEQSGSTQPNSAVVRLYSPGVVALYTFLYLPIGVSLYGINLNRRGHRLTGILLLGVALVSYCMFLTLSRVGHRVQGFGIMSVLIALGLLGVESRPYKQAALRGAVPARWWPPLLVLIGLVVLAVLVARVGAPVVE